MFVPENRISVQTNDFEHRKNIKVSIIKATNLKIPSNFMTIDHTHEELQYMLFSYWERILNCAYEKNIYSLGKLLWNISFINIGNEFEPNIQVM